MTPSTSVEGIVTRMAAAGYKPEIRFRPAMLGFDWDEGWLVFYDGAYVLALYTRADGRVGNAASFVGHYNCRDCIWPTLKDAKKELRQLLPVLMLIDAQRKREAATPKPPAPSRKKSRTILDGPAA